MGYIDYAHRKRFEDGYVRQAEEWGLTHHVILTVKPTTAHGRSIKTSEYAAKVADSLAHEVCDGPVVGAGDRVDDEGAPHVHILASRKDARRLLDAWRTAELGHVKVKVPKQDELDFRRTILYVFKKFSGYSKHTTGMVYLPPTQTPPRERGLR